MQDHLGRGPAVILTGDSKLWPGVVNLIGGHGLAWVRTLEIKLATISLVHRPSSLGKFTTHGYS